MENKENGSNGSNGSFKNKLSETFENLKKKEHLDNLYSYAQNNTRDTLAYILMIIGIIFLFFYPLYLYGGFIVGVITGLYFSKELSYVFTTLNDRIEEQGVVRSLILAGFLLALLISAPAIIIGVVVAVAVKQIVMH
jgi:hypothetical protein